MAEIAHAPVSSGRTLSDRARETIEKGSKSFARAAKLMPQDTRESVYLLYAWCRHCDDFIDDQHLGFPRKNDSAPDKLGERVDCLRRKTLSAFRGNADVLPFQALARVIEKHDIPERFALDLIDGFAMDANAREYICEEDTLHYCYHVAGTVGVMMAMVMGVRDRATLVRASDLGIAFQLTNIARDVIDDLENGRIYLPQQWLHDVGLDARSLAAPSNRTRLFAAVSQALDRADRYYASSMYGVSQLPFRCAWSIASAQRIYRAIGAEIRRAGPAAWDTRASTSAWQKIGHVAIASVDAAATSTLGRLSDSKSRENLWTPPALRDGDTALPTQPTKFAHGSAQSAGIIRG